MGQLRLHHRPVIDIWSRLESRVHAASAGRKCLACLAVLVAVSVLGPGWALGAVAAAALLIALLAGLPIGGFLLRAALVLPFTAVFVISSWLSGDVQRAMTLLARTTVSAFWALLLVSTTPFEQILKVLHRIRAPRPLVDTVGFLWRYLGVVAGQASRLRIAAAARGADSKFSIAAVSVSVLFASSYARAQRIHHAMQARLATGEPE